MSQPSERRDRRDGTTTPMRWLLLTGNRLTVSVAMLLGVGGLFVAAGLFELATVTTPNRVMWYLNGTVNGLLTLVPISVGVNQIVLSHEFGSVKDLYDRRKEVGEFRKRVEDRTDTTISSPQADAFFETLLTGVSETATSFRREAERRGDDPDDEMERYARTVVEEADRAREQLAGTNHTMLDTLLIMLDYDDSLQYYETRRLRSAPDDLPDDLEAKLDELVELFDEIDAARQYIKTVVVERQLARLSRMLVYTGLPAVAVAALGIFTYRDVAGLALSHGALVAVAGTLVALTLTPLAILSAYILRVATIARRTAAFGPFVSESDRRAVDDDP